jgi:hypothetical protein
MRLLTPLVGAFAGVLIGFTPAWFQNRDKEWGHEMITFSYAGISMAIIILLAGGIIVYRHCFSSSVS